MHYTFDQQERMGLEPFTTLAVAALPGVAKAIGDIFGKKKKKVTPPAPAKPVVPTWVWITGSSVVALVSTAIIIKTFRRKRR